MTGQHTYIDAAFTVVQQPDYFGRACEIVAAVPDSTDPHPTNDWYRVRFADGVELVVAPEELDPIPTVIDP